MLRKLSFIVNPRCGREWETDNRDYWIDFIIKQHLHADSKSFRIYESARRDRTAQCIKLLAEMIVHIKHSVKNLLVRHSRLRFPWTIKWHCGTTMLWYFSNLRIVCGTITSSNMLLLSAASIEYFEFFGIAAEIFNIFFRVCACSASCRNYRLMLSLLPLYLCIINDPPLRRSLPGYPRLSAIRYCCRAVWKSFGYGFPAGDYFVFAPPMWSADKLI